MPGQSASSYKFTSSLAVQVLNDPTSTLQPRLSNSPQADGRVHTKPLQISNAGLHNSDKVEQTIAAEAVPLKLPDNSGEGSRLRRMKWFNVENQNDYTSQKI